MLRWTHLGSKVIDIPETENGLENISWTEIKISKVAELAVAANLKILFSTF